MDEATRFTILSSAVGKTRGLLIGELQQLFGILVPELEEASLAQLLPQKTRDREAPFFALVQRFVQLREEDLSSDEAVVHVRRIKKAASDSTISEQLAPLPVADLMRLRFVLLGKFARAVLVELSRRLSSSFLDRMVFFSHLAMAAFFLLAAYLNLNDPGTSSDTLRNFATVFFFKF
jgi:hypothetical protein